MIIVNNQEIASSTILSGEEKYPEEVDKKLKAITDKVIIVNALEDAKKAGNVRTVNVVMMGALSNHLPFEKISVGRSNKVIGSSQNC